MNASGITRRTLCLVAACVGVACAGSTSNDPSDADASPSGQHDAASSSAGTAGGVGGSSQDGGAALDAAYDGSASPDAGTAAPSSARGVMPARSAQAFIDSVGVNTHITYTDRNYWDFPQLASTLADLGVRHIRDGQPSTENYLNPQSTAGIVTARMQMLAAAGVKATLMSGYAVDPAQATDYARAQLAVFKHLGAGIAAFEHTNEPDLFAARDDDDWDAHLRAYMPVLWQERNADADTAALWVLGPSVVNEFAVFGQAFPTQRDVITHCNLHPYPGGAPPENNVLRPLGACRAFIGDVPAVATETGYHTAIHDTSGHNGVSDAAQGIYIPRLFLEYFQRGFVRTHSYELLDEYADPLDDQREAQFGLVRLDWSRKPAFVALKRLLALLSDPGTPLAASGIELRSSDGNVRVVLLQKRDDSFWIALWRPASVFDLATKADVAVTATPVTLTFGATPSRVLQHALRDSDASTDITPDGAALTVEVGAEVVLLETEGLPARSPLPQVVDRFDDLSVAASSSGVVIEETPARYHDYDDGLAQAVASSAQLTYDVDGLHDFALRVYRFCQGCINEPLDAVAFERSDNGSDFVSVPHAVVDRRSSMDAREVMTLIPQTPLPESTQHLRIVLGSAAPKLSELVLRR